MLGVLRRQKLGFSCVQILILIFSLLPEFSAALGFGQIKLYSYLNEPLDAEIEILNTQNVDPSHIIASLGSSQDFERAELSRPYYLSDLRFQAKQENGRTVIRVSTDEPMDHPYLEFLINVSWPEGRIVRGYTLLLDPAPLGTNPKRESQKTSKPILKENRHAILRMHEKLAADAIAKTNAVANQKQISKSLVDPKPTLAEAQGIQLAEEGQTVKLSPEHKSGSLAVSDAVSAEHQSHDGISPELRHEVQPLEKLFDNVDRQKVAEINEQPIPRSKPVAIDSIEESKDNENIINNANNNVNNKAQSPANLQANSLANSQTKLASKSPEIQFELPAENINLKNAQTQNKSSLFSDLNPNTLLLLSGLALILIVGATVRTLKRFAVFEPIPEKNIPSNSFEKSKMAALKTGASKLGALGVGALSAQKKFKWLMRSSMSRFSPQKNPSPLRVVIEDNPILEEELNIKLKLARQYLDVDDKQSAREVLEEIIDQGNKSAIEAAKILLSEILAPEPNLD